MSLNNQQNKSGDQKVQPQQQNHPIIQAIINFFEQAHSEKETSKNFLLLGRIFIFFMYVLILCNIYVYAKLSIPSMLKTQSIALTLPGYPERVTVRSSSTFKALPKEVTEEFSSTLNKLLSHRNKSYLTLIHGIQGHKNICQKCPSQPVKPLRSHHCRLCMRDVMLMDHHCPWINNCIGIQNQRYFLLFNTYMAFASCLMIFPLTITEAPQRKSENLLYQIVLMKNFVLSIIMLIFSIWNWYLACKGQSVIEFMSNRDQSEEITTYELPSWRENLFVIFGTSNITEMILPIHRDLPLSGLEWTFMNYGNDGDSERLIK
ncbi:UNKNOWN [Stylonychia lemnae]|uniref:Palmitoyltransferase n=1 Tax=Stylonychia lemnae TaxID=5949 RepID=A0A078AH65_STYLE|nr:UNKNOWN [Stylonychia lemnae]|eukprot:CDW81625.1 UNKNOWN [Stylonychia lemnae]